MEEVMLSHYICGCGFGRDSRKTDESIVNHVRGCHGVDICIKTNQPFFECNFDNKRLLNMRAVQEHLQAFHGVRLEKHYYDEHHHEVTPPPTHVDAEAPCEATAST